MKNLSINSGSLLCLSSSETPIIHAYIPFTHTHWIFVDYVLYPTVPFWYFLTFSNIYFYSLGCFYFSSQCPLLHFQLNLCPLGTLELSQLRLFCLSSIFFLTLDNSIFTSSCLLCISSLLKFMIHGIFCISVNTCLIQVGLLCNSFLLVSHWFWQNF